MAVHDKMNLGADIQARRERLGWTPYRLAKKVGVKPDTVVGIEAGRRPHHLTRTAIERALREAEAQHRQQTGGERRSGQDRRSGRDRRRSTEQGENHDGL